MQTASFSKLTNDLTYHVVKAQRVQKGATNPSVRDNFYNIAQIDSHNFCEGVLHSSILICENTSSAFILFSLHGYIKMDPYLYSSPKKKLF